ncbi:Uncharacterized conserved protein, DUF924 family [Sphingomonas gellani]|uniref:Uncharacterized conserved protein, DUF924 family n=1 Tax=Sphingomonas gellani TaxID=1166340 RepID=A0A1H7YFC9_9SPHN|nr:Uncharacterized conserved protein, DUF924 family [Sphingomonas gellani]
MEQAREVLGFWFGLPADRHFAKDDALDAEIRARFAGMRDRVLADKAEGWRDDPDTLLAAIILLDQFSRNIHRGSAEAFRGDDLAASLTLLAIDRGWEERFPPERRVFLLMPLMHAEDAGLQALSVNRFEALDRPENTRFAHDHADVFRRFGRFPGRNAALGRHSTPEEEAYLAEPGAGW